MVTGPVTRVAGGTHNKTVKFHSRSSYSAQHHQQQLSTTAAMTFGKIYQVGPKGDYAHHQARLAGVRPFRLSTPPVNHSATGSGTCITLHNEHATNHLIVQHGSPRLRAACFVLNCGIHDALSMVHTHMCHGLPGSTLTCQHALDGFGGELLRDSKLPYSHWLVEQHIAMDDGRAHIAGAITLHPALWH